MSAIQTTRGVPFDPASAREHRTETERQIRAVREHERAVRMQEREEELERRAEKKRRRHDWEVGKCYAEREAIIAKERKRRGR